MKSAVTIAIIFISLYSKAQNATDSVTIKTNLLLKKNDQHPLTDIEKKELAAMARFYQEKAFELDEMKNDYKSAFDQAEKATIIYTALKDSVNEANLRKYKGFLLGHLRRYDEGKKEIYRAISLFTLKGRKYGVAVSHFDLSSVYEFESRLDSAIYFAGLSLSYWKPEADTGRILIINNQLINLFIKSGNLTEAKKIQAETALLFNNRNDVHWMPSIDYYFLSASLFEKLKNTEESGKYKRLYTDKIDGLKQKNIITKSKYASRN